MRTPRSFTLSVPDAVLDDLRDRLSRTRFLDDSPRRPPSGMSADYLRDLVQSWRAFDWRAREQWLGEHPQFLADIEDTTVHFAHLRAERPDAPCPARDAWLAAHIRAAAGLRRSAARLPRGRREPSGLRFLDPVLSRPHHGRPPRHDDAPAHDRGTGLPAVPHLRGGRVSERQRPHRSHSPGFRGGHPRHPRAFPVGRRAHAADPARRACVLRTSRRGARHGWRVRSRAGDPARHPRCRPERLTRWTGGMARREARRVERHPRRRPERPSSDESRGSGSSPRR